jgi:hypothetical protein
MGGGGLGAELDIPEKHHLGGFNQTAFDESFLFLCHHEALAGLAHAGTLLLDVKGCGTSAAEQSGQVEFPEKVETDPHSKNHAATRHSPGDTRNTFSNSHLQG